MLKIRAEISMYEFILFQVIQYLILNHIQKLRIRILYIASIIMTCILIAGANILNWYYCRFQITLHLNILHFVTKFRYSLRSSKVHFRIRKPVCKLRTWLASLSSGANQSLCLQTGLQILKWTFEICNKIRNITVESYL